MKGNIDAPIIMIGAIKIPMGILYRYIDISVIGAEMRWITICQAQAGYSFPGIHTRGFQIDDGELQNCLLFFQFQVLIGSLIYY